MTNFDSLLKTNTNADVAAQGHELSASNANEYGAAASTEGVHTSGASDAGLAYASEYGSVDAGGTAGYDIAASPDGVDVAAGAEGMGAVATEYASADLGAGADLAGSASTDGVAADSSWSAAVEGMLSELGSLFAEFGGSLAAMFGL